MVKLIVNLINARNYSDCGLRKRAVTRCAINSAAQLLKREAVVAPPHLFALQPGIPHLF